MSSKPKWSVELHGECPFPDRYDVIEVAADLEPSGPPAGGGGAVLTGESYSVSSNNGFTPPTTQFVVPWDDTADLPYDANMKTVTLPADGIYAVDYEVDFDAPPESWHWYAVVAAGEQSQSADGDLLSGGGGWERSAIFGSGVLRVSGERTISLRLALIPDPTASSPVFPACSYAELDICRIV